VEDVEVIQLIIEGAFLSIAHLATDVKWNSIMLMNPLKLKPYARRNTKNGKNDEMPFEQILGHLNVEPVTKGLARCVNICINGDIVATFVRIPSNWKMPAGNGLNNGED
jgi:hypothetical protein